MSNICSRHLDKRRYGVAQTRDHVCETREVTDNLENLEVFTLSEDVLLILTSF